MPDLPRPVEDPAERGLTPAPRAAKEPARHVRDFQPDIVALEDNPMPGGAQWLLWIVLAFVAVAIAWMALAEVDRVVVAPGRAVTTAQRIVINPLVNSQVVDLPVSVGQVVRKGEVLVRLDPTFAQADVAQLTDRLASVSAQYERLAGERKGAVPGNGAELKEEQRMQADIARQRQAQHRSALRALEDEVGRLESALATNRQQSQGTRESYRVAVELEQMRGNLAKSGHVTKSDLLEATRRRIEIETEMKRLESQEAELRHQLSKARAEREAYLQDWQRRIAEDLVSVKRERDALAEQLKKALQQQQLVDLRAPADAVVLEVAARGSGSVAKEAEPIVTLVPLDAPLEAEVEIRAADIGFVRTGQKARIKLDAFPFQRHGTLQGTVRTVTEDAFQKDERVGSTLVYRARVTFDTRALRQVPETFRIIPGMTLTGEIRVGERSVMSYLLWPLIQTFDEGLREP